MNSPHLKHRITPPFVHPQTGSTWDVFVHAIQRPDGRWIGEIEFIPQDAREAIRRTGVETTQPSDSDVVYWAGGLSQAYFEGAFDRASGREVRTDVPADAQATTVGEQAPSPTPIDPVRRLAHLQAAEQWVMERFTVRNATTLATDELFNRGPFANADLVRAFEDLEKRWRYLVRETEGGIDRLRLTVEGGAAAEMKVEPAGKANAEPPRAFR